jgi:spore germination protein YaaH
MFLVATWLAVFLSELKAALGTKILSVTVPPIWAGGSRGYPMYNWPATIGAGIVDRFRIMIYDYSTGGGPPGPIGPISWFNDVASYVTSITPVAYRNRVQLGVPTYGRSWATVTSGVCPDGTPLGSQSVQMENAATLAASKKATVIPDAASGETTFGWTETFTGPRNAPTPFPSLGGKVVTVGPVPIGGLQPAVRFRHTTCTVRRTVWVPNEWSVAQKAQLARTAGFGGIIMWAFGYETLATWTMLKGS